MHPGAGRPARRRAAGAVRFLTEIADDFRRFVDEIGDFRRDFGQEFFADSSEESEPSPPVLDPLGPRLKREAAQAAAKEAAKLQLTGVAAVVLEGLPLTEREKELGEKNDVYIHMGEVRILQFIRIIIRFTSI